MKIVKQIPVFLLFLLYTVLGIAYFLHLLPNEQMPGNAGAFTTLLYTTGFLTAVKVLEVSFGLLTIIPKTRALGLLLLAPITVNILMFEIFMVGKPGIGIALVLINAFAIYQNKEKYSSILA